MLPRPARKAARPPTVPPESKDHAGVIAFPPLIFAGHTAVGAAWHYCLWPVPLLPPLPARIIGTLLAVMAGTQAWWASRVMHRAGTNVNPHRPTVAIVSGGPYVYTRNPMYLSLCLLHLGIALLINGLAPLLLLAPLALTLNFGVIKREERYLAAKFGESYLSYQRSVRRWL